MGAGQDVEVLVSGKEPGPPPRPWLRRLGWLAVVALAVGVVAVQETGDEPLPEQQAAPPTSAPPRPAAPVTVLPEEEVEPFWSVGGIGPGAATPPPLQSNGRPATVRVQCIGPGTVRVRAKTGKTVEVTCPDAAYESLRFEVYASFLSGTGRRLDDPVSFEIDASQMAEGSQWRVWTFLTYTLA